MHTRRPSSVFEHFRAFWSEVEPLRQSALSPAMAPPAEGETTGALVHAPMSARDRLLSVLRAQDAEVSRWAKGPVLDHYREAQYVMGGRRRSVRSPAVERRPLLGGEPA